MSISVAQRFMGKLGAHVWMVTTVRDGREAGALMVRSDDAYAWKIARIVAYVWHMHTEYSGDHVLIW